MPPLEELSRQNTDGCIARGQHSEVTGSGMPAGGGTVTLKAEQSGGTFLHDLSDGITYVLPVPVLGMKFRFYTTVSVTNPDANRIETDSASTFIGGSLNMIIAGSGTSAGQVGDETSDVAINMNGSTSGGLKGTSIDVEAMEDGSGNIVWMASGFVVASGALASPFV